MILDRLRAAYGSRSHVVRPALDELILTVLSQNTSDINSERAYAAMRERYPIWEAVLAAPVADLVEVEQLTAVEEAVLVPEDLLRHAVGAAEVAPVGDRDPKVPKRPAEGVEDLRHLQTH